MYKRQLIGVSVTGWLPGFGGGISESQSRAYWRGMATPIAINDFKVNGTAVTLTLKNKEMKKLRITEIYFDNTPLGVGDTVLMPGSQALVTGTLPASCGSEGTSYTYQVKIVYDNIDTGLTGKTEIGNTPLVGKCAGGGGGGKAPGGKPSNWADSHCNYRKKLTFDNSGSTEDLTNFPVLVKLNSGRIAYAKTDATDIRFYDADNSTLLPKETELWDESGDSYIWVKVPQVDAGSSSDYIWAYYNCTNTNTDSPAQVWDSNYKGVWHLSETSGTHYDSTSNNNDGTPQGGLNQDASGKINGADEFDGSNDYVGIPDSSSVRVDRDLTISVWIYPTHISKGRQSIVFKHYNNEYEVIMEPSGLISFYHGDGSWEEIQEPGNMIVTQNKWNYVVITRTMGDMTIRFYLDGNFIGSDVFTDVPLASSYPVEIGLRMGSNNYFEGIIDEVRISNTVRSADWIKASYLSSSDSMISFGSPAGRSVNARFTYTVNDDDGIEWVALTEDGVTVENETVSNCDTFYTNTYYTYDASSTYVVSYKDCEGHTKSRTYEP